MVERPTEVKKRSSSTDQDEVLSRGESSGVIIDPDRDSIGQVGVAPEQNHRNAAGHQSCDVLI